jgi:hypothetical protein
MPLAADPATKDSGGLGPVQMQKAGLSEEIILNKIAGSTANFDIGTQDLIRLKEAGVNDNIINAMVQKSGNR